MATRSAWAKLMVSGSSAEQPRPARPKARTPATSLPDGRAAMATNAAASTNGSRWYVRWLGNRRWIGGEQHPPERHHRPERGEGERRHRRRRAEPRWSCRAATSCRSTSRRCRRGRRTRRRARTAAECRRAPGCAAGGAASRSCNGRRPAGQRGARRAGSSDSTGSPHQNPRPTKMATNTGASAVPNPRSALSTRTDRSIACGWNAAVNVLSVGTVSPNPTPTKAVATRSRP